MNSAELKTLARNIRKIAHGSDVSFPVMSGKIISINESELTCKVSLSIADGIETDNINLNCISLNANGFIQFPKIDSNVIIAEVDGPGKWAIINCTDLTKAVITIGNTTFTITTNGVKIEANNKNLGTVLQNILTHIQALTVPTAVGTSGIPINLPDFITDSTDLNSILL